MAPDDTGAPLKLRAEDADDLAVLSACLQDALVPVRDLAYVPSQQIFVFVANRFRWESGLRPMPGEGERQRILCAVTFSVVGGVDEAQAEGLALRLGEGAGGGGDLGVCAGDDRHRADRGGEGGGEGAVDQQAAAPGGGELGAAESRAGAGGQHHRFQSRFWSRLSRQIAILPMFGVA